jgi:hypothetical protein
MPHQPDIDPSERRFLTGVLALRDVPDVERYVAGHFRALDLPDPELRVEVLGAISDAYRIDRALAPDRPLLPLLETLLASRVTRMRSRLDRRLTRVA